MMARVRMYHAGSDRYQDASQEAFDTVWSADGWVIAPGDATPDPDPVPDPPAGEQPPVDGDGDPAALPRNGRPRR